MMTIEQYRKTKDAPLPKNGEGLKLPQLIDDIYSAREHLVNIRQGYNGSPARLAELALGHLNRALTQLGIQL